MTTVTDDRRMERNRRASLARGRALAALQRAHPHEFAWRLDEARRDVAAEITDPLPPPKPRGARPRRPESRRFAEARSRAAEMWVLYADDGLPYEEIGERFGLTRERVRQIFVDWYGHGLIGLVKHRRRARARLANYVEKGDRWPCLVCGAPTKCYLTTPVKHPFCAAHGSHDIYPSIILTIDAHRHEKHREIGERRHLAETGRPRVVRGRTNRGQRWMIRGSKMWRLVAEAIENDWPFLDRLPPEIVDRVRAQMAEADVDG